MVLTGTKRKHRAVRKMPAKPGVSHVSPYVLSKLVAGLEPVTC